MSTMKLDSWTFRMVEDEVIDYLEQSDLTSYEIIKPVIRNTIRICLTKYPNGRAFLTRPDCTDWLIDRSDKIKLYLL